MELNKTYYHYDKNGNVISTITKTKEAPIPGEYKETSIDREKKKVDFRLVQVNPSYIIWKGGKGEKVTRRQLKKLQKTHTWATDF